jgi:Protein of unknown function (DUF3667)
MSAAHSSSHCRNCGTFLGEPAGNFCPNCGQDTLNHPPSFWEFIHEFVTHYVALEGKLWKTLVLLFFKPAQLTREYREGRKQRYISPLRLYITASFLFFLVFKVFDIGGGTFEDYDSVEAKLDKTFNGAPDARTAKPAQSGGFKIKIDGQPPATENTETVSISVGEKAPDAAAPRSEVSAPNLEDWKKNGSFNLGCDRWDTKESCKWLEARLKKKYEGKTDAQMWATLRAGIWSNLPYAIFFSLPFFALLTKLLYIRRGYYFGEHFVYALHIHAFTFFAMLLMAITNHGGAFGVLALLAAIYYLVGLQRFFGGRWWMNILRYGALAFCYQSFLMIVAVILLIAVFLG